MAILSFGGSCFSANSLFGRRFAFYVATCLSILVGSGCRSKPIAVPPPLTRLEAIQRYNVNVRAVPAFKANVGRWHTQFLDRDGKRRRETEQGGRLYYRPPGDVQRQPMFYLRANAFGKEALVLGSNAEEFWMYSRWGEFGRWGKFRYLGRSCADNVGIDPHTVLEFVGLLSLPEQLPYPAYKVCPETNVLVYIGVDGDGFSVRREIIIDRRTDLPIEINAYDSDGRQIIHSELQNYQPIAKAMLPGNILLAWPQQDSFIRLKVRGFKVDSGTHTTKRNRLFTRPDRISDIEDYRQIDTGCEE